MDDIRERFRRRYLIEGKIWKLLNAMCMVICFLLSILGIIAKCFSLTITSFLIPINFMAYKMVDDSMEYWRKPL